MRCLIHLCSDLAIRSGTAERISPQHFDAEANQLTFRTKYGRSVSLPVSKPLRELFALHAAEPHVPFVAALNPRTRTGRRPAHHRSFRDLLKSIGITRQLTFHDLRRTTAVRAYELTRDLRMVQALLGHKELAHTLYYLDHNSTPVSLDTIEAVRLQGAPTEIVQ